MNLRQANHGRVDSVGGDVGGRLFGSRAGEVVGRDRRRVLGRELTGRDLGDGSPGGHDQGSVGARENRAERLDDASIGFAIRRELREVVVKGEVDDAVRAGGAVLQALGIVYRSAIGLCTGGGQSQRLLIRTIDADHLVARADQFLDDE